MKMKVILRFFLDDHFLDFLMSLLSTEHYLPRKDFLFISVYRVKTKLKEKWKCLKRLWWRLLRNQIHSLH